MKYNGIAFAGPMRAGKSTAADYLANVYDASVYSVGYYVRQALMSLGLTPEQAFPDVKTDHWRELMQSVGHGMREYDKCIWLDQMCADIEYEDPEFVAVDDVRYTNELLRLRSMGYALVYIDSPDFLDDSDSAREHPSEHGADDFHDWDAIISTTRGDTPALYEHLDRLIEEWE